MTWILLLLPRSLAAEAVWVEGESDTTYSTFNQHNWYSDVDETLLSPGSPETGVAGSWAAHYANDALPAQASWSFDVAEGGDYTIWARVGAYRVAMWAAVDGLAVTDLDLDNQAREVVNLVHPTLDVRFLAWVKVDEVELAPGGHTMTFGLESHPAWEGAATYGGVDAFVVTNVPRWAPTGAVRPEPDGEAEGTPDGWFPFLPKEEDGTFDSVLDRSGLLDAPAGVHGALRRAGADLAFADGTPVKLWGVNVGEIPLDPALRERQARFWAGLGINAVRLHSVQNWLGAARNADGSPAFDPERLDALDHWFAVLAEQGIYSCWSVFYPLVLADTDDYPAELRAELPASGEGRSASGLVTIRPELQEAEDRWVAALLAHTNPYTGRTYAEDAALAAIELRNEDSIFWHAPLNDLWTGDVYPEHTAALQAAWADWLATRYADDDALLAAWGPTWGGSQPGDSLSNPAMAIYAAWDMAPDGPYTNSAETARMGDFIGFLAETQRDGYTRRADALRDTGFGGLVVSTAWMAGGDAAHLANAWTDDALDAIDRHTYLGGGDGVWRVIAGGVEPWSHFDHPGEGLLAIATSQIEDKPLFMTEWGMPTPNPYAAEGSPIEAFYGLGLQGYDASFHFTASTFTWQGGWPENYSYVSETPHTMGLFPALATAVHEGHVAEGAPAAVQRVSFDAATSGVDARLHPPAGEGFAGGDSLDVPPEVALLGRVSHKVGGGGAPEAVEWGDLTGTVESLGGELSWDVPGRYATVRTARTQGILGFAGGVAPELPDVEASFTNGYAVLLVTALDGLPIAESHRMLVTAIARERPAGAAYNADDTELLTVGGPPLLMEPVEATLRIPGVDAVTALDVDGWPRVAVPVTDGAFAIDGRWRTLWYLAERPGADDTGGADATDDTNATDGDTEGCGCATPGAPGAPLALALGALAMVRRRRGAPPSPSRVEPSPRRHSNGG